MVAILCHFLVADTALSVCPSVRPSVGPSVRPSARVEKWENKRFRSFSCMCGCGKGGWVGHGVWLGVGRHCPPICNDIVTPRHLFLISNIFHLQFDAAPGHLDPVIRRIIAESGHLPVLTPPGASGYVQPCDSFINAAFQKAYQTVRQYLKQRNDF